MQNGSTNPRSDSGHGANGANGASGSNGHSIPSFGSNSLRPPSENTRYGSSPFSPNFRQPTTPGIYSPSPATMGHDAWPEDPWTDSLSPRLGQGNNNTNGASETRDRGPTMGTWPEDRLNPLSRPWEPSEPLALSRATGDDRRESKRPRSQAADWFDYDLYAE